MWVTVSIFWYYLLYLWVYSYISPEYLKWRCTITLNRNTSCDLILQEIISVNIFGLWWLLMSADDVYNSRLYLQYFLGLILTCSAVHGTIRMVEVGTRWHLWPSGPRVSPTCQGADTAPWQSMTNEIKHPRSLGYYIAEALSGVVKGLEI